MIKEKAYKYKNYQISYDEGLKDRSALVIGTKEKDTLYITGELYDESARAVIKILDNLESQLQQKENIIKEVRKYIVKHCVNEKVSKEVGFNCYTMADTNELEYIMKKLGDDDE